ncbi:MAG TPA: RNA polymerase factor sigma-54 [Acidobacteriaceae bacterium]|nr:RNA polymerase factor sigma-54 [Acidobacteriaceae bacterium]
MLQPKLNLKVSQRQVLTPGLVQMVSVLALNKLELKEMINAEMVENPVLEEIEESGVTLEEMDGREAALERPAEEAAKVEKDPFDEIDFGSYFQDYLDPGFRTGSNFEDIERPSFDNFLSQPSTLSDHLIWQLGAMNLPENVRLAAELVIGNLNGDGYLIATDEELAEALREALGSKVGEPIPFERGMRSGRLWETLNAGTHPGAQVAAVETPEQEADAAKQDNVLEIVCEARKVVNHLDPVGVGARDLRECLLIQIRERRREGEIVLRRAETKLDENGERDFAELAVHASENGNHKNGCTGDDVFEIAAIIVRDKLQLLQKRDVRELTKSCGRSTEEVQAAVEFIRTLDPRPGQRYDTTQTRLIEPDVAFAKRDGEYVVVMNEDDMPSLRLSHAYRKMLREKGTEKDVRDYVKERYKSAIQLLRNIEQRKNTIVRTCEVIVRRQKEFLESGEQSLKPMMIKEVAEEIGVHPSTVSRAVANKYVHTPQGVYELRYFFSEGVNGPEGADLPLVLLKRKVKKLIEDEDPSKPLTDDHLAAELQRQGIQVTRRTVAKYREDMQIPSTHQRRVRC